MSSWTEMQNAEYQREAQMWTRTDDATHPISKTTIGEMCRCGKTATHKIGEETAAPFFHNISRYICCEHFEAAIGHMASYPYPEPQPCS